MAKRIFEKAELIPGLVPGSRTATGTAPDKDPKTKTAPGTMMGFLTAQSNLSKEAESLRAEVDALKAAAPLRQLNPTIIRPSRWANRHAATFAAIEFEALKEEIRAAGGNVQPIKVRPVAASPDTGTAIYELIYGHRRHRACLELGLPVAAVVEEADDLSLFQQMERENRGRKSLSAWEQGTMYGRALDEGLFASQRKLAEGLGVDLSLVSKSLALARLPEDVVLAFATPLDIQFRWAAPLSEAMQKDPDGVLARAREVRVAETRLAAAQVLEHLLHGSASSTRVSNSYPVRKGGKPVGTLRVDPAGKLQITLQAGAVAGEEAESLVRLLEGFIAKHK